MLALSGAWICTTGSRPGAAQSPASVGHKSIFFLPPGSIRTGTPSTQNSSTRTLHFVGAARFPSRTLLCQARGSARPAADPARPGALPVSGTSPSVQVVGDAVPPCGAACAAAWGGVCVGSRVRCRGGGNLLVQGRGLVRRMDRGLQPSDCQSCDSSLGCRWRLHACRPPPSLGGFYFQFSFTGALESRGSLAHLDSIRVSEGPVKEREPAVDAVVR